MRVTIYYNPACGDCHSAFRYFEEHEIEYKKKNVEDPRVRDELKERYGRMATPTIIIDGHRFLGFTENREKIARLLGQ